MLDLVTELLQVMPSGLDSFFFANSEAKAVESAVRLCKYATGRTNAIFFSGSFTAALALQWH